MSGVDWVKLSIVLAVLGFVFAVWRLGRSGGRVSGKMKGPAGVELELQAQRPEAPGVVLEGVRAGRDVVATTEGGGSVHAKQVTAGRDIRASVQGAKDEDT